MASLPVDQLACRTLRNIALDHCGYINILLLDYTVIRCLEVIILITISAACVLNYALLSRVSSKNKTGV